MESNNKDINIEFINEGHGWILFKIGHPLSELTIHISDVFDPFPELMLWLKNVSLNKLPSDIVIDEEGCGKRLYATQSLNDKNKFELKIFEWDYGSEDHTDIEEILYGSELDINSFIKNVITALTKFIENNRGLEWSEKYQLIDLPFDSLCKKNV